MLFRICLFLFGFGLTVIGFVYIISYINLMSLGYNFIDYVKFIISKPECLYALIGIIILILTIYIKGDNDYELHL